MQRWRTSSSIGLLLLAGLLMNTCAGDEDGCECRSGEDSEQSDECDSFCEDAHTCGFVMSEDICFEVCVTNLSEQFLDCWYPMWAEGRTDCLELEGCFDEYGDEMHGDDDTGFDCDYQPSDVEDVCDYPEFSFYAGQMSSSACHDTCDEVDDYGVLVSWDSLCEYCYCCGYEDLL